MILKEILPYKQLLEDIPVGAAILDAKTFKLEEINEAMIKLWDRDKSILGARILEFLPEIAEQDFPDLLKRVSDTGESYKEDGALVMLKKEGRLQRVFMDYSYTPILGSKKNPVGILIVGTDISTRQLNHLAADEHDRSLRAMVMSAPVAMCIYKGPEFKIDAVNQQMLDLWQRQEVRHLQMLTYVFYTGHPSQLTERGISYSCTALRDGQGNSTGCVLIALKLN